MVFGLEKIFSFDSDPGRIPGSVLLGQEKIDTKQTEKKARIKELKKQFNVNAFLLSMGVENDEKTGEPLITESLNIKKELFDLGLDEETLYKSEDDDTPQNSLANAA